MRGRVKNQSRKLYEPSNSTKKNWDSARYGDFQGRPGAMLAIEIRELDVHRKEFATWTDEEREGAEIDYNTHERTKIANASLLEAARKGDARFFRDFAAGIAFCRPGLGNGTIAAADRYAAFCFQYEYFMDDGGPYLRGTLTDLYSEMAKVFETLPDIGEVGRLCKKLGIQLTKAKAGRPKVSKSVK